MLYCLAISKSSASYVPLDPSEVFDSSDLLVLMTLPNYVRAILQTLGRNSGLALYLAHNLAKQPALALTPMPTVRRSALHT